MPTSSSTCLVGLPPQWHGSTGGRSIGSKPLQEPDRRWSLREVDRRICLFPFLMWREEGLVTVLSSRSKGFRVMSPESTLTSTSRGRGSNILSLLLTVVSTLWAIPNNGVSYRFYYEIDILTPSDYVFQAEAYRR